MAFERFNEDIFFGRSTVWTGVQDFYFDSNDAALKVRKLFVADIGDPPDFGLRRAGPDNVGHDHHPPEACGFNQNIGTIYWQGYEGTEMGWHQRNAQIYARYRGPGQGALCLSTSNQDRVIIEEDGTLNLAGVPYESDRIRVRTPDGRIGWIRIEF